MPVWFGGQLIIGSMKGSLGLGIITTSGKNLFLTNAHVTAGFASKGIGRSIYGKEDAKNVVGTVYRTVELTRRINQVDASVCLPLGQLEAFSILLSSGGKIKTIDQQEIDMSQRGGYFYVSRGVRKDCSYPKPGLRELIRFDSRNTGFFDGHYIFTITNASLNVEHGDSGSVLLSPAKNGIVVCGVVFAGDPDKKTVYVQSFSKFIKSLESGLASLTASEEDLTIAWPK